ncbi:MAG: ABC transporter ATP-binding protein [Treponema sp.]|nr:ABC transporter ATP-binding protein [Treponema sp.]
MRCNDASHSDAGHDNNTSYSSSKHNGASLSVQHVTKTFPAPDGTSTFAALSDVSFELAESSCAFIAGANGSGKSVLMAIIARLESANSGIVRITRGGKNARAGLVFQDADSQLLGETPLEDVSFSLKNIGVPRGEAKQKALEVLSQVGLADKALFPARFLSGGEKRKLAVASVLALDMPLIIFDEPYANLDYHGVQQVNEIITLLKKRGITVLILTHELEKSLALCNRFIVLHHGKKMFDGSAREGLSQDLEAWNIRNPLVSYKKIEDLLW